MLLAACRICAKFTLRQRVAADGCQMRRNAASESWRAPAEYGLDPFGRHPEHMTTIHFQREVTANIQRLVEDRELPEDIRKRAGDVLDLSSLLATWPVPRSLKLDEELKRQFLGLCRLSGGSLCGTQQCFANDGEGVPPACRIEWGSN